MNSAPISGNDGGWRRARVAVVLDALAREPWNGKVSLPRLLDELARRAIERDEAMQAIDDAAIAGWVDVAACPDGLDDDNVHLLVTLRAEPRAVRA